MSAGNAGNRLAIDLLAASAVLDATGHHAAAKRIRHDMAVGFWRGLIVFGGLALLFLRWVFGQHG